jgi:hypothetical protein
MRSEPLHSTNFNLIASPLPTGTTGPSSDEVTRLSTEQRARAASIVARGCDRSTAGRLLGFRPVEWERIVAADDVLAAELAKAEADAEVHHMTCVHNAAKEPKNFRGSIWWLERMRPEVYHRRDPDTFTTDDLGQFIEALFADERDEAIRRRILDRLRTFRGK